MCLWTSRSRLNELRLQTDVGLHQHIGHFVQWAALQVFDFVDLFEVGEVGHHVGEIIRDAGFVDAHGLQERPLDKGAEQAAQLRLVGVAFDCNDLSSSVVF